MKKFLLFWLLTISLTWSVSFGFDYKTDCEERNFIVTAYYSPKENQNFYFKENFKAEKTLNWEWLTGASWKWVFNWMLAAPKNYEFGTKIVFPTLWIGEVADRGGAIVESGNLWHSFDRIDIWMGYWEEGLIKALTFGKQTLTAYICSWDNFKNLKTNIKFENIPVYKWFFDSALWLQKLEPWRRDVRVWKLQTYLIKLWYLKKWQDSGKYDETTQTALCKYQTKKKISSKKYSDCGYFGERTRYVMKQDVKNKWFLPTDMFQTTNVDELKKIAIDRDMSKKIIETIQNISFENYFDKPFKKNEQNEKVIKLQELLKKLWHYNWESHWKYDNNTKESVYNFQKANWLLKGFENDPSVNWYMWPRTRLALNKMLIEKTESDKVDILNEIIWEEKIIIKPQKKSFQFYRSYTKNEWPNQEIRILQKFLTKQWLYSWTVNWIYDKKTMDAVYDFQKKFNLISTWDSIVVQGFMGPNTRKKINELIE